MRFDLPNLQGRPGFEGFEDCVDYAMGSASKKEEGAFLIALTRFAERLVANVAVARSPLTDPIWTTMILSD